MHESREEHSATESTAPAEHKARAPVSICCGVITCSDTRTPETDTSGQLIQRLLHDQGHRVAAYHLVKDEPFHVRQLLEHLGADATIQAVILNGGTGISRRDTTFEAVDALLEKRLDGFGELFRFLSFQEIGSAAILSRATAGLYCGKIIFSVPGSRGAVRLAMERLILPELPHIVGELSK
ncbi:MAG: MogA/MoaB family molybdenum cofactor biosynthesis protein [Nitrospirae bacterium]|nr:MAG: MogA/MoaB family molybdenum cofactor biosynthesis protein [Nitrospirota bacterium]